MYSDLQSISPEQYMKQITKRLTELHAVSVSTFLSGVTYSPCFLLLNKKIHITKIFQKKSLILTNLDQTH